MRIQAYSLSQAYEIASKELGVLAADINIEIISKPSSGFLGLFKKIGEFEATANKQKKANSYKNEQRAPRAEKAVKSFKTEKKDFAKENKEPKDFSKEPKEVKQSEPAPKPKAPRADNFGAYNNIIDTFNQEQSSEQSPAPQAPSKAHKNTTPSQEMLDEIKAGLKNLFGVSSFKIDVIEVSKDVPGSVFIKLDGEDCALLIGKEGYRYKALSYLLFNWLNSKYNLSVRLEIAEFLKNQEIAVNAYLQNIIERVKEQGFANTKPLDGVLLKIALEQLRATFPQKYVGIKNGDDGKYIVVNDFHKK